MSPLLPPEPSLLLERKEAIQAKKIRFEINRIKLPIGLENTFGVIKHPGASLAVPITKEGKLVVLRQYRFAVEQRILEFPAGTLEEGESPLISMKRELAEEAGYEANKWDHLGEMLPCPGYSNEVIHMFLARGLNKLEEPPAGDEDEDMEILHLFPKELDKLISSGDEALDGKSITALYRAKQFIND